MDVADLTISQMRGIAAWQPLSPEFKFAFHDHISPLVERINNSEKYYCDVADRGDLSNYATLFIQKNADLNLPLITGLIVQLSLVSPFATYGWGNKSQSGKTIVGWPGLLLEQVCDPNLAKKNIERHLIEQIGETPYRLLTLQELSKPLPEKIHLRGECWGCSQPVLMQALFLQMD